MKKNLSDNNSRFQVAGILLTLLSAMIFGLAIVFDIREGEFFPVFLCTYFLSLIYFCSLWFTGRLRSGRGGLDCFILCLVQFLISAYALNRCIPVFELSVDWLSGFLVVVGIAYCSLAYFPVLPAFARGLTAFTVGLGFSLFLYLSIYLLPLYPVSVLASVGLGISLHSFIPLLFVIFTVVWIAKNREQYPRLLFGVCYGIGTALVVVIFFCWGWSGIDRMVTSRYQHTLIAEDAGLPSWIKVAETLPHNWLAEKYLKAELVYSTPESGTDWFGWRMPTRNFEEVRKHDPLVMIASFFNPDHMLSEEERIKILEVNHNARHQAEEKFWTGKDLATAAVISNVRLWPQFRMAYTEKTITVENKDKAEWSEAQEALYTFHLPEGGVVTSLSLWINGKEEKGILTTKGKADTAYRQIVNKLQRDPSVVHWQEGNRISVRVFPVPHNGKRIFKIGITAPLTYYRGKLQYENIYFEGPDALQAKEIVQVDWMQQPEPGLMEGFEEKGDRRFIKEGSYRKDWNLEFKAPLLVAGAFHFEGNTYRIDAFQPRRESVTFQKVFLDVNASWTEEEFKAVLADFKGKPVFVYDENLITVDAQNQKTVFERLQQKHFSLFPLQIIEDPATALLITKGGKVSPDLNDLKETLFATRLKEWMNKDIKLCVFDLGQMMNPYLKTLKEFRTFRYEQGNPQDLQKLLQQHVFVTNTEDQDHVVIDHAGIQLSRSTDTARSNAPDHFMRLFAYNHLMQQLGRNTSSDADSVLVAAAQSAYVVTPLSSLIVLETAADYERFNIKDSKNSLQNAGMHAKGAVPEPEEWALLIAAALLILYICYKEKMKHLWSRL